MAEMMDVTPSKATSSSSSSSRSPGATGAISDGSKVQSPLKVSSGAQSTAGASSVNRVSVSISLHPLVLLNISDHWTRMRAEQQATAAAAGSSQGQPQQTQPLPVIGCIVGKHFGRRVEVESSFEMTYCQIEDQPVIDKDYYQTRESQFKEVFANLDVIGWYVTSDSLTDDVRHLHKQVLDFVESPLLLMLNPFAPRGSDLPVTMYESVVEFDHGNPLITFSELTYSLITEPSERIGLDHMAKLVETSSDTSVVTDHLVNQFNAIKMLHGRIRIVSEYVSAVAADALPPDWDLLREIASVVQSLPVVDTNCSETNAAFYAQANDVSLVNYLGVMTKGCLALQKLVTKLNVVYQRRYGKGFF